MAKPEAMKAGDSNDPYNRHEPNRLRIFSYLPVTGRDLLNASCDIPEVRCSIKDLSGSFNSGK